MGNFSEYIKNHTDEYKSIPFWSWNDKLNPDELKRQIRDMKRLNMGGFFMHARSGLETEYQSDEWYNCINESIKEAKKLGMQAWAYDENGWPSGFAGGKLLTCDENYAHYLEYKVLDTFDENAFGVYILENNTAKRVQNPIEGVCEYHTVYRCADESYVDTMNPDVTREFICLTHSEYKEKTGEEFGKTMPGFFTDEPQYYRWKTIWSDMLLTEFKAKYGYDVMDILPCLFISYNGAREQRYDYYYLCHELFTNNFIKIIYDWCNENGVAVTGHAIEEKILFGQMWCCGGVMPFYEYMNIPGVDYLGKGHGNDISSKQVGSVAAQLGKKKVLSEMFACCGWDVTPLELKRVAEHQYKDGVNLMCQHLYPYSIRGQRKRDYPAFYSEHQSWQEAMGDFNLYFARLGAALSIGEEITNVLVIHPMHSCYLDFIRVNDRESIAALEDGFAEVTDILSQHQIAYHYGDEIIMRKYASVEGNKIRVGKCVYDTVVLPEIYTLDASTAELLREFTANGGKICAFGTLPDRIDGRKADLSFIKPNTTLEDMVKSSDISVSSTDSLNQMRIMRRDTEFGKMYYVLNQYRTPIKNITINFKDAEVLSVLDLTTLETRGLESTEYTFDLAPVESVIFVEENAPVKADTDTTPMEHSPFEIVEMSDNAFTLDYARRSEDGFNFSDIQPIVRIKDNLLAEKYKGKLWLKYEFNAESIPEKVALVLEEMPYESIIVNGNEISLGTDWVIDRSFKRVPVTDYIKTGHNEITVKLNYYQDNYVYHVLYDEGVSESLRNCLNFNTEIESLYLFGKFDVKTETDKFELMERDYYVYNGTFTLAKAQNNPDITDLCKNGYPFFCDSLTLKTKKIGGGNILRVPGVYSTARVFVDGKPVKYLLFDSKCDLSDYIKTGNEEITVKVWQSRRNLFGPHHFEEYEIIAAPPFFSFEKQWKGAECPNYVDRYSLKKFGVEL